MFKLFSIFVLQCFQLNIPVLSEDVCWVGCANSMVEAGAARLCAVCCGIRDVVLGDFRDADAGVVKH